MTIPINELHQIARDYQENGFVVVRGVFPEAARADLERELQQYVEEVAPTLPPGEAYFEESAPTSVKALHNLNRHSGYFAQLHLHPTLRAIVRAVLPEGEILPTGTSYFAKLARVGSATPPHQDNAFQTLDPPLALTVTISLTPALPENGILMCRRGSHRAGLLPHRRSGVLGFSQMLEELPPEDAYPEEPLALKPGDISLHHVNTVHYSGPNRSAYDRRQFAVGYRSSLALKDADRQQRYQEELQQLHDAARKR